jgi:hypothetical protein
MQWRLVLPERKEARMALFDRSDERGYGYRGDLGHGRGGGFVDRAQNAVRRGWDQVEDRFQGGGMDNGSGYGGMNRGGMSAGGGSWSRPMDRDGGLHQRNSWSDGAWTADAAERTDREWNHEHRGGTSGGMSGGMGMNRGMRSEGGWNLGGGDRDWGHTGNLGGGGYDRGYRGGGMERGGGFMDRAGNAIRRGWDQVEDRFDRDEGGRMHMGGSSMRGGTSWAGRYDRDVHQPSDVRGYRDDEGHYGVTHAGGMTGGGAGMNRYGGDYDRGRSDMSRGREGWMGNRGGSGGGFRYDEGFRGGRDWF